MDDDKNVHLSRAIQLNRDINNMRREIKRIHDRNREITTEKKQNTHEITKKYEELERLLDEQHTTMNKLYGRLNE